MLKKIIHNTTFTRNVALPGIIVLVLLSLLSALFPLRVNNWLTFVQSFIYKNLSWMYILLVSFFVIFLLAVAFSKLGNIRYGVTAEKRVLSDYLVDEDNTPDADNGTQYIPVTYYSDGRTGNDIQYLSKDEIIADVLREYGRYISSISDNRNAMVFVDKKPQ
ncbi:BCCT family transporter [Hallella mizrahii]|uniref:Uncharacterized protein n=1 Tax=Hallella mizrahii TaxID=2606637 RepID=A0A7K0KEY2_9BACT|nr:BCCT family transporter [Hallella mizrahii]MST83980.1 hypothetical protein [Hallella mizrahii]